MTTMVDAVRTHASCSQRGSGGGARTLMVVNQTLVPGAFLRNDLSGWVGFRFQVGSQPITVTDVGRWMVSGNSGTHSVKLVQDNGFDVPGALASVSLPGTPGQFKYATLSSGVSLAANTSYYLVSQEVSGGDLWYNHPDVHLTLSGAASFSGPAWSYNSPTYYYWVTSTDEGYVPVSLKDFTGQSGTWVPSSETRYVYDGMVVIQERDGNSIPKVSYTRGLDLSGSQQGAGGIGGLLARSEHSASSPYTVTRTDCYHADGNGNITALVAANFSLSASYQYDPYGRVVVSTGDLRDANVYRFSSKMVHASSGLYYYGYRFYDPNLQRWLNRDPIQEEGGINLYGFAGNHMPNAVDMLGLKIKCKGAHKDFYEGVINCWRNNLPPDSQLRKLVKDLDDSADTYEVCDMRPDDRETNQVPYTRSKNVMDLQMPPTRTRIDPRPYQIGRKGWRFTEALAHELLHAHDWLVDNSRRREDGGHGGDFFNDEAVLLDELRRQGLNW